MILTFGNRLHHEMCVTRTELVGEAEKVIGISDVNSEIEQVIIFGEVHYDSLWKNMFR